MREFEGFYPDPLDFVNSTAAARVNGYLYGHGNLDQFKRELSVLGLTTHAGQNLEIYVRRYSR